MNYPVKGEKWGAVECVDVCKAERQMWGRGADNEPYVAETYTVNVLVLKCECGKRFEVEKKGFLGRRRTQDCGCGAAGLRRGKKVLMLTYMPTPLLNLLKRYAAKHYNGNVSEAVRRVLEEGVGDE